MSLGPLNANVEPIKSLAFGSISASFAKVGTPLAYPSRLLIISNGTDKNMLFSIDGTNTHYFVPSQTSQVLDLNANRDGNKNSFSFAKGTQFWVKQVDAPTSGSVYVSNTYGVING